MPNHAPTATLDELLAHQGWARRLARRLTADVAEADDLVQETWVAASRRPPASDRPLRPWLAVVLRNLWINRRAAARRREVRQRRFASDEAAASPEWLAERVEGQRLLAELVAALEEPYRQTLVLRYFEELSSAAIARRLGVPAGTVRWRLKVALDELRRRLDDRHGGRRAIWTAALVPLSVPLAPRPRLGFSLAAGLAGLTLAAGLLVGPCSFGAPASGLARAGARPTAGGPGPIRLAAAASRPSPEDLAACQAELRLLRVESAAVEVEHRKRLSFIELFRMGEPNPAAQVVFEPIIERAYRDRPQRFATSLECRTWVCRVLVVAPVRAEDPWGNDGHLVLQQNREVARRTFSLGIPPGNPSKDYGTGEALTEMEVFLMLNHPSGAPERSGSTVEPALPEAPVPATASACVAERDRLQMQIRAWREDIEARVLPHERFPAGPANPELSLANPELSAEVRRRVVAHFPRLHTVTVEVECRANICAARWPSGPPSWVSELQRDRWFHTATEYIVRVDDNLVTLRSGGRVEAFLVMASRPRADGGAFLRELVDTFEGGPTLDDCAARFPAAGSLQVRFDLTRTGDGPRQGEPARLTARFGNTLAGTPLGTCLQDAIEAQILSAPLPALPVGNATSFERYDFPRPPRPQ